MVRSQRQSRKRQTQEPSAPRQAGSAPRSAEPFVRAARSTAPVWLRWGLPVLVVVVTFLTFWPALSADFVNWDDDKNIETNHYYRGFETENLEWMFTKAKMGHYHPLTWLSLALDHHFYEMEPQGYHRTNMILHALNAGWFFVLALALLGIAMPAKDSHGDALLHIGATVAALLFSLHPLRVESVAWVTERRDVLSTFFLIPCVLCYLRYVRKDRGGWGWYAASLVLLALSLLSKAWGMTLPVVLLLLDFYPLRRLRWGRGNLVSRPAFAAYLDKLPYLPIAAWAAYKAAWAQSIAVDTMKSLEEYGILQRAAQAFYGLAFYVWKTVLPIGLIPIYEIPVKMNPFAPQFVVAAVAVVAITVLLLALRRRWPAGLASWAVYGVVVSPVLGIAQSGPQLAADRYSYLSCMPWAVLGGAALIWCLRRRQAKPDNAPSGDATHRLPALLGGTVAVALIATLASLTWRQTKVWQTSRSLWEHTVAVDPNGYNAHNNLGILLKREGLVDEALEHYETSLAIKPDNATTISNVGSILLRKGRTEEALEYFKKARKLRPSDLQIYMNVATCHHKLHQYDDAIRMYRAVISRNRFNAKAYSNLGQALVDTGKVDEGIASIKKALEIEPGYAKGHNNIAFAHMKQKKWPQAIESFRTVIKLVGADVLANPRVPERDMYIKAYSNMGTIYADHLNDPAQAIESHQNVLKVHPNRLFDLMQLGRLMMKTKRYDKAAEYFQRALKAKPGYEAAEQGLQAARRAQAATERP